MGKNFIAVYLAGACANEPDEGRKWRVDARQAFNSIVKYDNIQVCVVDPTDYFSYSYPVHKSDKQIKAFYMSKIRKCDVILVNVNNSKTSPGTCMEVQHAVDHNIPVVGFGKENAYPWLMNVDCDVVFDSLQEAINYIKDYYMKSTQPIKVAL